MPKSDIPPLNDQYHRARKNLALFSGLLFAWEFIGIELSNDPIATFRLSIKTPLAAPYVLLVLIVYFLTRTVIEWYQSDAERRTMRVSRLDFSLSITIAALAIFTFLFQAIAKMQLFTYLAQRSAPSILASLSGLLFSIILLKRKDIIMLVKYFCKWGYRLDIGYSDAAFILAVYFLILLTAFVLTLLSILGSGILSYLTNAILGVVTVTIIISFYKLSHLHRNRTEQ
jgi:hypothetical protein